jgi:hypothetical protein
LAGVVGGIFVVLACLILTMERDEYPREIGYRTLISSTGGSNGYEKGDMGGCESNSLPDPYTVPAQTCVPTMTTDCIRCGDGSSWGVKGGPNIVPTGGYFSNPPTSCSNMPLWKGQCGGMPATPPYNWGCRNLTPVTGAFCKGTNISYLPQGPIEDP